MKESNGRIQELYNKWFKQTATPAERAELLVLLQDKDLHETLDPLLRAEWEALGDETQYQFSDSDRIADFILQHYPVRKTVAFSSLKGSLRIGASWLRYAAVIIIFFGLAVYFWTTKRSNHDLGTTGSNRELYGDIKPGSEKATLTLADGSKIVLDRVANGNVANQGNSAIVKLSNGKIAYNLKGSSKDEMIINTLSTPNGGQYNLTLPDGTKAWLNAASSIRFPAAFVGNERVVKITGEVYFEVAKDNQKPFIVDINGKSSVQVLGTKFNINSYDDEGSTKTTLLEGSVKVIAGSKEVILKPGFQAAVRSFDLQDSTSDFSQNINVLSNPDIEQILAWQKGLFNFNGLSIREVLNQLARWYDIKVQIQGKEPEFHFLGKMYRSANLSEVLKMLEKMEIKFRMEGRTLIIL